MTSNAGLLAFSGGGGGDRHETSTLALSVTGRIKEP